MTRDAKRWSTIPAGWCLATVLALTSLAGADAVRLGEFWYQPVRVASITEGQLRYVNEAGTHLAAPLPRVTGLRLNAHPALAEAETALAKGDVAEARAALARALRGDPPPWLRDWVTWRLLRLAGEAGDPRETVRLTAVLAARGAEPFYFTAPPTQAVHGLDTPLRRELERQLTAALRSAQGEAERALLALLDTVRGDEATPAPPRPRDAAPPGLVLSRATPGGDAVTRLLRAGDYAAALARLDRHASTDRPDAALRFYQRGMARLALAEASGAARARLYKDAALDLMRVAIYFPHSAYHGPAILEAGYIHHRLGRADIARRLYDQARLLIDDEADPALGQRLRQLAATLER